LKLASPDALDFIDKGKVWELGEVRTAAILGCMCDWATCWLNRYITAAQSCLVDIADRKQITPLTAHVANLSHNLVRQTLLNLKVVIHVVGRNKILGNGENTV
jgi:hypothetical protein